LDIIDIYIIYTSANWKHIDCLPYLVPAEKPTGRLPMPGAEDTTNHTIQGCLPVSLKW